MFKFAWVLFLFVVLFGSACQPKNRYADMFTYSKKTGRLNVLVESTAGTNKLFSYDYETNTFRIRKVNGKDESLNYLPMPFNIGFIPSTSTEQGKVVPLRSLLICENITTSSLVETIPIGAMSYKEAGKEKVMILTVPSEISIRSVNALSFDDLQAKFPSVTPIIKEWYANHDKSKEISEIDFKNEAYAKEIIEKYRINSK